MTKFTAVNTDMIKMADLLVQGQGDGRISEKDMVQLLSQDLTIDENKETLIYIITNYNLTETGKTKLLKSIHF
jgi:hypothetical protein